MERKSDEFDPYDELGVALDASRREIVRAYRRLAHEWHPDVHQHDPSAVARFRAITAAYDLLTDGPRRAAYDRLHRVRPAAPVADAGQQPVSQQPVARRVSQPLQQPVAGLRRPMLLRVGPVHIEPLASVVAEAGAEGGPR
jgi:curved DNA-binding protein CbpA